MPPVFTGNDNCEGAFTPVVTTPGPVNVNCSYSQTWYANYTDGCGNVAVQKSITYTWIDGRFTLGITEPSTECTYKTATVTVSPSGCSGTISGYEWKNLMTGDTKTTTLTTVVLSIPINEEQWIVTAYGSCGTATNTVTLINFCKQDFPEGQIYHTATTCDNYMSGDPSYLLDKVSVAVTNGKISNATPGVFFYYATIYAPSASFTIDVDQFSGSGLNFAVQQNDQIKLYTANCQTVISSGTLVGGKPHLNVSNAVPGAKYILSVKYDVKSIIDKGWLDKYKVDFVTLINGLGTSSGASIWVMIAEKSGTLDNAIQAQLPDETVECNTIKAYPNPGSAPVTFEFSITDAAKATLDLYSASGQRVATLFNENVDACMPQKVTLTRPLAEGTYVYVLWWNDKKMTGKLIIKR